MRTRGALEIAMRVREHERRLRRIRYDYAPPPRRRAMRHVQLRASMAGMLKSLAARLERERIAADHELA